jgi:3-dehydrosphinganine reductase
MPDKFAEKTYIVTGAASGIGLSTARLLHAKGARLVLWDLNAAPLRQAADELKAERCAVDVAQPEQVRQAMAEAASHTGKIDGVIHAAGILRTGLFEQVDLETHLRTININLIGTLIVVREVLAHLKASRGSLILMGSIAAFYGPPEYASYGASKAGVLNLAQGLRVELTQTGMHIGVVCPHSVDTPMLDAENRKSRFVQRFDTVHTPDQIAQWIVRGIERRQFMILPGLQPRLIFLAAKLLSPSLAHFVMSRLWR